MRGTLPAWSLTTPASTNRTPQSERGASWLAGRSSRSSLSLDVGPADPVSPVGSGSTRLPALTTSRPTSKAKRDEKCSVTRLQDRPTLRNRETNPTYTGNRSKGPYTSSPPHVRKMLSVSLAHAISPTLLRVSNQIPSSNSYPVTISRPSRRPKAPSEQKSDSPWPHTQFERTGAPNGRTKVRRPKETSEHGSVDRVRLR